MKVGDLVKVNTKHHGDKVGVVINEWDEMRSGRAWLVHIPNHWMSETIVAESDMEIVK